MNERTFKLDLANLSWIEEMIEELENDLIEAEYALVYRLHKSVDMPDNAPDLPMPKFHLPHRSPVSAIARRDEIKLRLYYMQSTRDRIYQVLDSMPKTDRELVEARYCYDVPYRILAEKYGFSKSSVQRRVESAISRAVGQIPHKMV